MTTSGILGIRSFDAVAHCNFGCSFPTVYGSKALFYCLSGLYRSKRFLFRTVFKSDHMYWKTLTRASSVHYLWWCLLGGTSREVGLGSINFNNLVLFTVSFHFGPFFRLDQCAVYILCSKIPTDPGLLKIRHSHRFVAVVIQFFNSMNFSGS